VYDFVWQDDSGLLTYVDTDFAGCLVTRRSRGGHLIKQWSSTQKAVSLSSGESDLFGIVKGAAEAPGIQSFDRDFGIEMAVGFGTDSAAAAGICRRSGIGRVRHLAVGQLWVQEGLRRVDFKPYKIPGAMNPAGMLTKHLSRDVLEQHVWTMSMKRAGGRATPAPQTQL
jgi:hypothetical protein